MTTKVNQDFLYSQLVKLGDMMGDGLHHEPDGKWISREYKKVLKALGTGPKRKNNTKRNNEEMQKRLETVNCPDCGGKLKQARSGSLRAICIKCDSKWQILKRKKKK